MASGGGRRSNHHGYSIIVKLLILGDSSVGKSSLLLRFCEDKFESAHVLTIGIDFKSKVVELEEEKVKLQLWDTAGQERFRNVTPVYFRSADGVILVYDVGKEQTFRNVQFWIQNIEEHADPSIVRLLVGNKSDLSERQVARSKGEALAKCLKVPFFETSAKTGYNVEETFLEAIRTIRNYQKNGVHPSRPSGLAIENTSSETEHKSSCCGGGPMASRQDKLFRTLTKCVSSSGQQHSEPLPTGNSGEVSPPHPLTLRQSSFFCLSAPSPPTPRSSRSGNTKSNGGRSTPRRSLIGAEVYSPRRAAPHTPRSSPANSAPTTTMTPSCYNRPPLPQTAGFGVAARRNNRSESLAHSPTSYKEGERGEPHHRSSISAHSPGGTLRKQRMNHPDSQDTYRRCGSRSKSSAPPSSRSRYHH